MPDTTKPIEISANAPLIDLLTAAGRYVVVITTTVPILLALLGNKDFAGFVAFFQTTEGATFVSAVVGVSTLAYGLWKTRARAQQMRDTAADARVPDSVASIR